MLALIAGVSAAAAGAPGENNTVQLFMRILELNRIHICVAGAGIFTGSLAALALHAFSISQFQRWFSAGLYLGAMLSFSVLALRDVLSQYVLTPELMTGLTSVYAHDAPSGIQARVVHQLSIAPTSMAIGPDNRLYVAGFAGMAYQNGVIVRLDLDESTGSFREVVVAKYLNRPHGIAFYDGDLFVSRAGQFNRAVNGRIVQEDTGMVTRLSDLDGDGKYDYFVDVMSGLPGAQQPDGLHQNNGIAFDADGFLYVTVGAPTDHHPTIHKFAGTVLRVRSDGSEVEVFARGLRNPFDLCFGPSGELFCTDNDDNFNGPGDEINHVIQGGHYGFPYDSLGPSIKASGVIAPILRSAAALQGITYIPPHSFVEGFDDCLYVAAYSDGYVNRVVLKRDGTTFQTSLTVFARVPGVIDIVLSPATKTLFACSYDEKRIYAFSSK